MLRNTFSVTHLALISLIQSHAVCMLLSPTGLVSIFRMMIKYRLKILSTFIIRSDSFSLDAISQSKAADTFLVQIELGY